MDELKHHDGAAVEFDPETNPEPLSEEEQARNSRLKRIKVLTDQIFELAMNSGLKKSERLEALRLATLALGGHRIDPFELVRVLLLK